MTLSSFLLRTCQRIRIGNKTLSIAQCMCLWHDDVHMDLLSDELSYPKTDMLMFV